MSRCSVGALLVRDGECSSHLPGGSPVGYSLNRALFVPLKRITRPKMMTPPCCMIVEDQTLIGMALEAYQEDAGFSVAGPFPSCADALQWLEHNTPQVAVL